MYLNAVTMAILTKYNVTNLLDTAGVLTSQVWKYHVHAPVGSQHVIMVSAFVITNLHGKVNDISMLSFVNQKREIENCNVY